MEGLKEKRIRKGFTQADMAKKLGVARNTFSQYENGKREPRIEIMKKMAEIQESTVDEIL